MSLNKEIRRTGRGCCFWYKSMEKIGRRMDSSLPVGSGRDWLSEAASPGRPLILCIHPASLWEACLTRMTYFSQSDTLHRVPHQEFHGEASSCSRREGRRREEQLAMGMQVYPEPVSWGWASAWSCWGEDSPVLMCVGTENRCAF